MLKNYFYYFHVTITGYGSELESNVPSKEKINNSSRSFRKKWTAEGCMGVWADNTLLKYWCGIPLKRFGQIESCLEWYTKMDR